MIVGLERIRIDLSYALTDIALELKKEQSFNVEEYKLRFIKYLNGEFDMEVENILKNYSYIFIAYSNLDKLIRNRRFERNFK